MWCQVNVWPQPDLLGGGGKGRHITCLVSPGGMAAFLRQVCTSSKWVLDTAAGNWGLSRQQLPLLLMFCKHL